jgi:hypothetical protein
MQIAVALRQHSLYDVIRIVSPFASSSEGTSVASNSIDQDSLDELPRTQASTFCLCECPACIAYHCDG